MPIPISADKAICMDSLKILSENFFLIIKK